MTKPSEPPAGMTKRDMARLESALRDMARMAAAHGASIAGHLRVSAIPTVAVHIGGDGVAVAWAQDAPTGAEALLTIDANPGPPPF